MKHGPGITLSPAPIDKGLADICPDVLERKRAGEFPVAREFLKAGAGVTAGLGITIHRDDQLERKWRRDEFESQQQAGRAKGLEKIHERQEAKKREKT